MERPLKNNFPRIINNLRKREPLRSPMLVSASRLARAQALNVFDLVHLDQLRPPVDVGLHISPEGSRHLEARAMISGNLP